MIGRFPSFVRLWLVGAILLPGPAAAAEPLHLRYDLWGGGLGLMGFEIELDESETAYRVDGSFKTRGVADWLLGFTLRAVAEGRLSAKEEATPLHYSSRSESRRTPRSADIEHFPDGQLRIAVSPPEEGERTPITPEMLPGTVDPLTATLRLAHRIATGGNCERRIGIFDARRRYDIVLEDRGMMELPSSRWSAYAGPARACRLRQVRIGGFLKERSARDVTEDATVWIAAVFPGSLPVPVRLEFDSGWGWVLIHLVEATQGPLSRRIEPK